MKNLLLVVSTESMWEDYNAYQKASVVNEAEDSHYDLEVMFPLRRMSNVKEISLSELSESDVNRLKEFGITIFGDWLEFNKEVNAEKMRDTLKHILIYNSYKDMYKSRYNVINKLLENPLDIPVIEMEHDYSDNDGAVISYSMNMSDYLADEHTYRLKVLKVYETLEEVHCI